MSKKSQLLVVVFISTVQLAVSLIAVAWLFNWFESRNREYAEKQVVETNRFVARLMAQRIDEMGLHDLTTGSRDWERLQKFTELVALPGEGFVSIINATNGKILCHPGMGRHANLVGSTWDPFLSGSNGESFLAVLTGSPWQKDMYANLKLQGNRHVVNAQPLSGLNALAVVHQPMTGIHAVNSFVISDFRNLAFAVVLIIGLLATVLNKSVVKRVSKSDRDIQRKLEQRVEQRTAELERTKNAIIFGLAKLAESRDNDTGEHLDRIRKYVTILATDLAEVYEEIDSEFIKNLGIASSLHDIGKVGIPDSILLKPGRLTSLERSIMEKHTIIGGECLEAIGQKLGDNDFLEMAREVAYWHHEHWDGGGYPHQLAEEQIPISARLVAVADVYDALTSRRPYKRGMTHTESRAIIVSGSGQMFDPEVVAAFLRHEAEFQQVARRYQSVESESLPFPDTPRVASDIPLLSADLV